VRYQERSISELAALPWASSKRCSAAELAGREAEIARDIVAD